MPSRDTYHPDSESARDAEFTIAQQSEDEAKHVIQPEQHEINKNHEIVRAFEEAGLPLDQFIKAMLNEEPEYQENTREGCGFTQASTKLAGFINGGRSFKKDMRIFESTVLLDIEDALHKEGYELDEMKTELLMPRFPKEKLAHIAETVERPESKLIAKMIADIFDARPKNPDVVSLPDVKEKIRIGKCTTAEIYFFDYMRGKTIYGESFKNRSARMNIVVDEKGEPLFIEKIGLGESHSSISLKSFYLNGVEVPPGSLVALKYDENKLGNELQSRQGNILRAVDLEAVNVLRFTTLVADPKDRKAIFGSHLEFQKQNGMPGAEDIRLDEFVAKAKFETLSEST